MIIKETLKKLSEQSDQPSNPYPAISGVDGAEGFYDRLYKQAEQAINHCTMFRENTVLTWYYLLGFPWSKVTDRIGRTERHVYRIRGEALEKLALPEDAIWLD